MSLSLVPRLARSLVVVLLVGLGLFANSASAQNNPPKLRNVSYSSPIAEFGEATVICGVSDPNPSDQVKLKIDWGDGNPAQFTFSYTNALTYITNTHVYVDRAGTNRLKDKYQVSIKLTDGKGGIASTNFMITVTNTVRLQVNASSPVVAGAPATERALEYREFKLPTANAYPYAITLGPDDNIWFTEGINRIGKITRAGVVTEFPVTGASSFADICTGPDNRLWFTCANSEKIGRITTNGAIRLFDIPHPTGPFRIPWGITPGPDGKSVWFVGFGYRLSRMNTNGVITIEYLHEIDGGGRNFHGVVSAPDGALYYTDWGHDAVVRRDPASGGQNVFNLEYFATPQGITVGPDNAVWFAEYTVGKIGRIDSSGLTEAFVGDFLPSGMASGPDGAVWFCEQRLTNCNVVRLKLNGDLQRFALPFGANPNEIVAAHGDSLWFTLPNRGRIGRLRYTDVGNVVLYINVYDSPNDKHTVYLDWADGSPPVTVTLPKEVRTHVVAHTYTGAGSYPVYVRVQDDDGATAETTTTVEVLPGGG